MSRIGAYLDRSGSLGGREHKRVLSGIKRMHPLGWCQEVVSFAFR